MIEIQSARVRARILPRGAAVSGLWIAGCTHSLVLGSPDEAAYAAHLDFYGALCGPIANRVSNAMIDIEGETWKLEANEGPTCLHGGPRGLYALEWQVVHSGPTHVRLQLDMAHAADGLPGNRRFDATYTVTDDGILRLVISARTDRTTAVNVAHHPYWNLDGGRTLDQHRLRIPAAHYLPVDDRLLPTGEVASVADTPLDFRTARTVPTDITLDHNLCLRAVRLDRPELSATLTVPDGVRLDIHSTEPGLQVYNGTGLAPLPVTLHDGHAPGRCAGIALEPQGWPDAGRHAHFPSILLRADEDYRQVTEYHLSG